MTVATNTSGRRAGEILVTDGDSGDHGFIRIHWLRSYADSNFTVIDCGGHQNRITGVRVLSQDSDNTYGEKILQVYVEANSSYDVKIFRMGDDAHYSDHTAHTPTIENTISGYSVHGNQLTDLDDYGFAHEEGIQAGGALKVGGISTFSNDVKLAATKKLYLDGGGNSYIQEESADNLIFRAAGGNYLRITGSNIVLNDPGASYDVRIEGNNDGNLFFTDGSADKVGVGTNSPQRKLHVSTGNTDIAARFQNTTSNGTVMELLSSGDSTTMYFQTDHIYSSSNLYLGAGNKITHYRGSDHRFQTGTGNSERFRVDANRSTIFGTGANGLVMDNDQSSTGNSTRLFFEGTSTSAIFQSGTALSFRSGATSGSSSGTQQMYINSSGAQFTNNVNVDGNLSLAAGHYFTAHNESQYAKYRMYGGSSTYAIGMYSGNTYGGLNDWAMTFTFNDDNDRGFLWRDSAHGTNGGAMGLTTNGKLTLAHSARIGYGETDTTTPGGTYRLDVSGSIGATADVVAYISSDKRLKDNIKNIKNPLEKLQKLNGVEFDWNDKQDLYKGHDIGVIAQEVEEVLPEIVDTRENGHKAVKYDRMVALLIEVAKEQQQQINELKEKLNV